MDAGASGIAIGRNIWQSKNPLDLAKAIKSIVFENKSVNNALKFIK